MNAHQGEIAWGEEVKGLQLGIVMARRHYVLGEAPAIARIVIANISAQGIQLVETNLLRDYNLELWVEQSHQIVPMTPEGKQAKQAAESQDIARRMIVHIQPDSTYEVVPSVRLDEWFEIKTPQTYAVRVRRNGWLDEGGAVSSGVVKFTIGVNVER